jgi:glyoxylase-like metal-dependent hydrolase (beta-lactamase superfamily II)
MEYKLDLEYNKSIREKYLSSFEVKEANFGKVFGSPYTFIYLINGSIFDTSVSAWAYLVANNLINEKWDGKIFLTHSHYDHLGGVYTIKKILENKQIRVYAHSYFEKVLSSSTAIDIINRFDKLDSEEISKFNKVEILGFKSFDVDVKIDFKESDRVFVSDFLCIYTPGHTKDSVSYYIPEYKALVMAESMGVPNHKFTFVLPEFLSSYKIYVESFNKLKELVLKERVSNFLLPHIMYFESFSDVKDFILLSEESLKVYVNKIISFIEKVSLSNLKDFDLKFRDIFNYVLESFYMKFELSQPLYGFEANVSAQVRALIKEFF